MTEKNATLNQFLTSDAKSTDQTTETQFESISQSPDEVGGDHQSTSQVTLFRLTADPFVNAGAAALAAQLPDQLETGSTRIRCKSDLVSTSVDDIRGVIQAALENTHRRTRIAHSINHALRQAGFQETDSRWVPSPGEPFPDGRTTYDDDEISADILDQRDIPETDSIQDFSGSQALYVQSGEYTGTNSSRHYPHQQEDAERYLTALKSLLQSESEEMFETCQCCGRSDIPSYKDPVSDDKVTYNQTFAPLASTGATLKPLGSGGRSTSHSGRCIACLVAGFYFAVMPKPVRQTASDDNDSRIFTPLGDFDRLIPAMRDIQGVRKDPDTPVGDENVRSRTVGNIRTCSQALQALDLFEVFIREVNSKTNDDGMLAEVIYRPTSLRTFVSRTGQTRVIESFDKIDSDDDIYDRVDRIEHIVGDSTRGYWPVSDILRWFGEFGETGAHITEKQQLGEGIIYASLERLERGVFGFTRAQFRDDGSFPGYEQPHPADLTHYFTHIMSQATAERIEQDDIEAIRQVASGIGNVFHAGDDISVLISLQNASTQSDFLRAFERASMQAQKQSTESPPAQYNASRDDDVQTVLELISNDETFKSAKRMFVIHAALAAQYENATGSSGSSGSSGSADQDQEENA